MLDHFTKEHSDVDAKIQEEADKWFHQNFNMIRRHVYDVMTHFTLKDHCIFTDIFTSPPVEESYYMYEVKAGRSGEPFIDAAIDLEYGCINSIGFFRESIYLPKGVHWQDASISLYNYIENK
jgi:hypothetical protein